MATTSRWRPMYTVNQHEVDALWRSHVPQWRCKARTAILHTVYCIRIICSTLHHMYEKMYIRQASKSVCRGHLKHARRLILHDDPTGAHMKEEEEDYALRAIFRRGLDVGKIRKDDFQMLLKLNRQFSPAPPVKCISMTIDVNKDVARMRVAMHQATFENICALKDEEILHGLQDKGFVLTH